MPWRPSMRRSAGRSPRSCRASTPLALIPRGDHQPAVIIAGAGAPPMPALVPFWKPPNSSDATTKPMISSRTHIRHPVSLVLRRLGPGPPPPRPNSHLRKPLGMSPPDRGTPPPGGARLWSLPLPAILRDSPSWVDELFDVGWVEGVAPRPSAATQAKGTDSDAGRKGGTDGAQRARSWLSRSADGTGGTGGADGCRRRRRAARSRVFRGAPASAAADSVRGDHPRPQPARAAQIDIGAEPLRGGQRLIPGGGGPEPEGSVPAILRGGHPDAVHRAGHRDRFCRFLAAEEQGDPGVAGSHGGDDHAAASPA